MFWVKKFKTEVLNVFNLLLKFKVTDKLYQWYTLVIIVVVGDHSWGRPEGSLFDSYYTEV